MTGHMGTLSSVSMGSVDLSRFVTNALNIELTPWQHAILERLPTRTITVSGFWDGAVLGRTSSRRYWAAWHAYQHHRAIRRQRLARMRTAYRRRRR